MARLALAVLLVALAALALLAVAAQAKDDLEPSGFYSSIAINTKTNKPAVSFAGGNKRSLYLATCKDSKCKDYTLTLVQQDAYVAYRTALVFYPESQGQEGEALMVFSSKGSSYAAWCKGSPLRCPSIELLEEIDREVEDFDAPVIGYGASVTLNVASRPVIAYIDQVANGTVHLVQCEDTKCKKSSVVVIDGVTGATGATSVAVNPLTGFPWVTFGLGGESPSGLVVAQCTAVDCSGEIRRDVLTLPRSGYYSQLIFDNSGNAYIAFNSANTDPGKSGLLLAVCVTPTSNDTTGCKEAFSPPSSGAIKLLKSGLDATDVSMRITSNGQLLFGFHFFPTIGDISANEMRIGYCTGNDCAAFVSTAVELQAGAGASMVLDPKNDAPVISYQINNPDLLSELVVVRCNTPNCTTYSHSTLSLSGRVRSNRNLGAYTGLYVALGLVIAGIILIGLIALGVALWRRFRGKKQTKAQKYAVLREEPSAYD